mmetsp:Transcript_10523/g.34771  ORF Transcript_10523/g.34771 Transcript_10523/m.34771 type:complete len:340 (+) Transcript_10523:62-1081(+)
MLVGTARALRPEWLKVSLASGCLASTCDTAVANMFYSEEEDWRPLRALAREVLHTSSDAARPKVATSGSRPVSYLSPGLAGELLGLAILRRDPWPALKRHGVESNRVAGRWSGVSKARFDTMAKTLEEALSYDEAAALGLWLRVAWEKARSRKDLLDFYDGLREAGLDARRSDVTDAQFLCDTAAPPSGRRKQRRRRPREAAAPSNEDEETRRRRRRLVRRGRRGGGGGPECLGSARATAEVDPNCELRRRRAEAGLRRGLRPRSRRPPLSTRDRGRRELLRGVVCPVPGRGRVGGVPFGDAGRPAVRARAVQAERRGRRVATALRRAVRDVRGSGGAL